MVHVGACRMFDGTVLYAADMSGVHGANSNLLRALFAREGGPGATEGLLP